jgi:hypothetical protein
MSDEGFLSRWSRRKTQSKAAPEAARDAPAVTPAQPAPAIPKAEAGVPSRPPPEPLPPVESLTPESDFAPFMQPEVDADTRRKAVKMLFQDPRYNVMDGLDVYIDDYSRPDPLPEGWLEKMTQMARLGEYKEPEKEEPPAVAADPGPAPGSSTDTPSRAEGPASDGPEPAEGEAHAFRSDESRVDLPQKKA